MATQFIRESYVVKLPHIAHGLNSAFKQETGSRHSIYIPLQQVPKFILLSSKFTTVKYDWQWVLSWSLWEINGFPFCNAFLRPDSSLQSAAEWNRHPSRFISDYYHLNLCNFFHGNLPQICAKTLHRSRFLQQKYKETL